MKLGDKVKVIARKWGHEFDIGEVVKVIALETESGHRFESDSECNYFMSPDEYEAVPTTTGTLAELDVKPGDVVEAAWNGDGDWREYKWVKEHPTHGFECMLCTRNNQSYILAVDFHQWEFRLISRAPDLSKLDYTPINLEKAVFESPPTTGPVITETVTTERKRIISGEWENVTVQTATADDIFHVYMDPVSTRAELIAARDILSQLIDAMASE